MKLSRFFISAGALTLGVVGVFATKPAKKFTTFNVTFKSTTGITWANFTANTSTYTTTANSSKVVLKTASGGSLSTLITTTTSASPVYHL